MAMAPPSFCRAGPPRHPTRCWRGLSVVLARICGGRHPLAELPTSQIIYASSHTLLLVANTLCHPLILFHSPQLQMVRMSVLADCLKTITNAEKRGKRQVLIRPSSKVVVKFLQQMQQHGKFISKVSTRSGPLAKNATVHW